MIMPDAAATKKCVRKHLFHGIEPDESEKSSDEDDDDAENETELDDGESDSEVESDDISAALKELSDAWKKISPPYPESEIVGKWYAVEFRGKRRRGQLMIAKLLNRFLDDEGGPVDKLRMRCLKSKVGSGT